MPDNLHKPEVVNELVMEYMMNMRNRDIIVTKRNGTQANYDLDKIRRAIRQCFKRCHVRYRAELLEKIDNEIKHTIALNMVGYSTYPPYPEEVRTIKVEDIQDIVEKTLMDSQPECAKEYILYRNRREQIRSWVDTKEDFIRRYKDASNTANATIDDNSNVASRNIGVLNTEIHKEDNIQISRRMVVRMLRRLFPEFDAKQYERDLADHIIYKHDESSFAGAVAPYCVALTMYPFLDGGIRGIGGLSAKPKNLDSYCGMFVNMIFAISAQFAGAVACPEALLYFDYFARKEWGNDYYLHVDDIINPRSLHPRTIRQQIHQHFQQIIYSINQPAAARGLQSAFVNFSYYDKAFFEGMFGNFSFPDFTQPIWESFNWLQQDFMQWFNEERTHCVLTFPVESFAMVYQDGKFADQASADFVAEEYARGHSFFTYISDTVDSLSSCCRLKNKIQTKEFNFTNGNMGLQTGSKSVITLNLNRILQDWARVNDHILVPSGFSKEAQASFVEYLGNILDRIYKYHTAYNELLWDMKDAHLLPVYDAGFIDLNKQYLTIGINGLNQAAEFLGMKCNDNPEYKEFCQTVFGAIAEKNKEAGKEKFNGHTLTFNTEQVPAESLAIKNYNWDKEDGYWVPEDTNLYASYIFKPNDPKVDVFEKLKLHGREYIGDYLDGGAAAHINMEEHLTAEQYKSTIKYAAEVGCSYFTFNIPMTECMDCGHIINAPVHNCPKCGSERVKYWTRIIGYLTALPSWSAGRQEEFKTRIFHGASGDKQIRGGDL
jgi:ribonucleoside-triphosphate reductase